MQVSEDTRLVHSLCIDAANSVQATTEGSPTLTSNGDTDPRPPSPTPTAPTTTDTDFRHMLSSFRTHQCQVLDPTDDDDLDENLHLFENSKILPPKAFDLDPSRILRPVHAPLGTRELPKGYNAIQLPQGTHDDARDDTPDVLTIGHTPTAILMCRILLFLLHRCLAPALISSIFVIHLRAYALVLHSSTSLASSKTILMSLS